MSGLAISSIMYMAGGGKSPHGARVRKQSNLSSEYLSMVSLRYYSISCVLDACAKHYAFKKLGKHTFCAL